MNVIFYVTVLFFVFYTPGLFSKSFSLIPKTGMVKPERLDIKSNLQKVINQSKILFLGNVEVRVDTTLHICADRIVFDQNTKKLYAKSGQDSYIKIEGEGLCILAQRFVYDFESKKACAKDVKIHGADGFIAAKFAYKEDPKTWNIRDILFTPCSEEVPHWSFTARKATLYKNYLIKVSGIFFRVKGAQLVPLPLLRFSLKRGTSSSGFLMPKMYLDQNRGVGIKTEYYWKLGPHCDDTTSLYLREYKGFVVSNEFRCALDPETYVILNGFYAREWNATLEKNDELVNGTAEHYWICGKYIQPFHGAKTSLRTLINVDIGTDKRFGYRFFSDEKSLEDNFLNTFILRWDNPCNIVEFLVDQERTLRGRFSEGVGSTTTSEPLVQDIAFDKYEIQDRVTITHAPHGSWSCVYKKLHDSIWYRHDIFTDYAFLKEERKERFYAQDKLVSSAVPLLCKEQGTLRCGYIGTLYHHQKIEDHGITFAVKPQVQLRSNLKPGLFDHPSAGKMIHAFLEHSIEWACPQYSYLHTKNNSVMYHQPTVSWNYIPQIWQKDWFYLDFHDRRFPENRVDAYLYSTWAFDERSVHTILNQGYEFFSRADTFFLAHNPFQEHLLPFSVSIEALQDEIHVGLSCQYSWRNATLLKSEFYVGGDFSRFSFLTSYVYQHRKVLDAFKFLSDIPHFLTIGVTLPFGKNFEFHYDGNFYAMGTDGLFAYKGIQPLLSSFMVSYTADCWGISFGSEEKRYRQSGVWHKEHSFIFRFKLDSLGSFAKRVRRTPDFVRIDS